MNSLVKAATHVLASAITLAGSAHAQGLPYPALQNVLQLSATGTVEVQQDLLTLILTTTRDGTDANAVQGQLKTVLDSALAEARGSTQPAQLEVRTGNFTLFPQYAQGGRISRWLGTAELVLEGHDFVRIAQTAGRIQAMTVGGVAFGLSREQRTRVEGDAQSIAVERFRTKATELARGFGFSGYSLREVTVSTHVPGAPRPMRSMAPAASQAADAPVPLEAGKTTITVTVSGSVQLK